MTDHKPDLVAAATEIAAAYVSRNHVAASDLPSLIVQLHAALTALTSGGSTIEREPADQSMLTSRQIQKSITRDALLSFIDGKPYKTLKRHLAGHGHDAQSYRQKYGLPNDYPMVAPSYSERRSLLAKSFDLGKQRKKGSKGAV